LELTASGALRDIARQDQHIGSLRAHQLHQRLHNGFLRGAKMCIGYLQQQCHDYSTTLSSGAGNNIVSGLGETRMASGVVSQTTSPSMATFNCRFWCVRNSTFIVLNAKLSTSLASLSLPNIPCTTSLSMASWPTGLGITAIS